MNRHEKDTLAFLESIVQVRSGSGLILKGYAYQCPEDFVIQHGQWFKPAVLPKGITRGAPRCCYGNALMACVKYGWRYVEGYALGVIPVHHAWNLTKDGKLRDITWRDVGKAYIGVEFSVGRADDATWNGDATVLDDWQRDWPILREPWTGEDFGRTWEPSKALRMAAILLKEREPS